MQGGNQEPKIQIPSGHKCGYVNVGYGDTINLAFVNNPNSRGTAITDGIANTLDTSCNQAVVQQRIRKLTPRECLRLQDFGDDFVQVVSDSQMYKQAGNSMSVNVLEMIFRQIEKTKEKSEGSLF
jgi:DNA (cytosine-5)-methyltransferase 1